MGTLITGIQAAQRATKKLPRGRTQMTITPGWDPEPEPPPVEKRYKTSNTDAKKKLRRLQRG